MTIRYMTSTSDVASDILEATMLTACMAGNDTTLAKLTKRALRFKVRGSLEEGNLSFSYDFPDGNHAEYTLLHGTFSTRTGFQAAAFEKTLTLPGGEVKSSIKLLFPGTAMRSQFADLNAFDTFWMKRIGSQIHNTREWLETEILPRIPEGKDIEISAHCLGTQGALWAKAFLEEEHHRHVLRTALIEPTAPGLVVGDLTNDLTNMYGISSKKAIHDLYRNVYSVFVDPPTIVNPFGLGNMWDTSAVGDRSYIIHLPETKLYEELNKAVRNPRHFLNNLSQKAEGEQEALQKEKDKDAPANSAAKEAKGTSRAKAFFRTPLGIELGQQFFKNHYLLSLSNQILNSKKPLDEVITESYTPDAHAMLLHKPPRMQPGMEKTMRQLLTATSIDTGRDIAQAVTHFCVRGGRMGSPAIGSPRYIWEAPDILTMDDTMTGNYPASFYRPLAMSHVKALINSAQVAASTCQEDNGKPVKAIISDMENILADKASGPPLSELQARAIVRILPDLKNSLLQVSEAALPSNSHAGLALAELEETQKVLRRAFQIRPEQDTVHYR